MLVKVDKPQRTMHVTLFDHFTQVKEYFCLRDRYFEMMCNLMQMGSERQMQIVIQESLTKIQYIPLNNHVGTNSSSNASS